MFFSWGNVRPLYYRHLEKDKCLALIQAKGNLDACLSLSQARDELHWWVKYVKNAYNVISHPEPQHQVTTDASLTGWGAESRGVSSGWSWTQLESQHLRNYLEMLPIYLGLQTFAKNKANTCVRVMCENTTVVNALMGTSHFDSCNSIAKDIWEWCVARNIWLSIAHIPHKQNLVAEFESQTGANFLQSKDGSTTTTQ